MAGLTSKFFGALDELAIWYPDAFYALSASDHLEIFNDGAPRDLASLSKAPAPSAWWRGESNAYDSSGNERHLSGAPTGYAEAAFGV